ncbi:MAG TPA: DinB family protein [Dehalococcoidia bacterium]|nr:DinB family protein [Dehalococcoidia bacterium]
MDLYTTTAHCKICQKDVERFSDVVSAMLAMPERLAAAVESAPEHTDDGPDGSMDWSPREVLAHLADTEVFRGYRIRRILSDDNPLIESFDEKAWASAFHYDHRELATSLAAFSVNRLSTLELVRLAGGQSLDRPYRHASLGPLTLVDLIHHTSDHDLAHLRQVTGSQRPPFCSNPTQAITGRRGYLRKRASTSESRQRKNVLPRPLTTTRACAHSAQSPTRSSFMRRGYRA